MDADHRDQIQAIKELRDAGDMNEEDYKLCMKTALEEALARSKGRKEVEEALARSKGRKEAHHNLARSTQPAAAAEGATAGATAGATGGESEDSTSSSTPNLVVDASLLQHQHGAAIPVVLPYEGNTNTGPVRMGIPVVRGSSTIGG